MKRFGILFTVMVMLVGFAASPVAAGVSWKTKKISVEAGEAFTETIDYEAPVSKLAAENATPWGLNVKVVENAKGKVVTSARVAINGIELLGPSDFSQKFRGYASSVSGDIVHSGVNLVYVKANGSPGTKIVVEVSYPVYSDDIPNNAFGFGDCDKDGVNSRYQRPPTYVDSPNMYYGSFKTSPWRDCTFIVIR
jgi:hypothetical protein